MKVKICGLFRPEDVGYVNEVLPDYIGFVFAKSRRQVTAVQASELKEKLDRRIKAVGVFVDAPLEEASELLKRGIVDLAQLHGSEDSQYVKRLKETTGRQVIKAVRVEAADDILAAQDSPADFLLLDHGPGGTGDSFDWSLVQDCQRPFAPDSGKPFFLAGGIHLGNLGQAMKTGKPFAIDVSSGAETDGVKDRDQIHEIVRRVRNV